MNRRFIGCVVCIIILIILYRPRWYLVYKSYIYKPKFYSLSDFRELQCFHDNYHNIKKEFLATASTIHYDKPRSSKIWSGDFANEAHEYLTKNKDVHGWVPSWSVGSTDGNHRWLNFPLRALGHEFNNNLNDCPTIKRLIKNKPFIKIIGFSKLLPRASISDHVDSTGMPWGTLAYHLGIDIPKDNACTLVVDGETVYQKNGQSLIFEPTYTHSAANNTDQDRTILFIELLV